MSCYKDSKCDNDMKCNYCAYNSSITTAYHRTNLKNKESILKEGLKTQYGKDGKYIYLSTKPDDWKLPELPVLFKINISGLNLAPLENWQLISLEDISIDRIEEQKG